MKRFCLVILALLLLAMSASAVPTVLDFEDLSGSGVLPTNYGGINWSFGSASWEYYGTSQAPYNPSSGSQRIYAGTQSASPSFSFLTPSVFNGAYVNGDIMGGAISFTLSLGGTVVATSGDYLLDSSGTGMFLSSGYAGMVDLVTVNTTGSPGYYILDDISYGSAAVPEINAAAATLPIAVVCCCLLVILDRRRSNVTL